MASHAKGRTKPKSRKAKINYKTGSKRRTQLMGRETKKNQRGFVGNYVVRSKVLRQLQIPLKDFRRLCILKGIYPRDPLKQEHGKTSLVLKGNNILSWTLQCLDSIPQALQWPAEDVARDFEPFLFMRACIAYSRASSMSGGFGWHKTYYHIKDVGYLAHEPILQSFRDLKAFMHRLRSAIGRKRIKDAQQRELNQRPTYKVDHLVKERYPRFLDAVRDLDDALCLVHLFAVLPQMRKRTSKHKETCKRLVKEWAFYVSRAKCLSKVFVSIKGIYFQAEIIGQPVTWLLPHMFTMHYPKDVDFSVMFTFLEFYETLLKFAMYKLFHTLDLRYPPALDLELDDLDAGLSTLKTKTLGDSEEPDGEEPEQEECRVFPTPKAERREAKKKLRDEEKKIMQAQQKQQAQRRQAAQKDKKVVASAEAVAAAAAAKESGAGKGEQSAEYKGDVDSDDEEMGEELTIPLEEAFLSKTEDGEEILANDAVAGKDERRKRLFKGLKFFFGREVPKSWLELVVVSCGGVVGWEGEGSPYSVTDASITHQVVDRPTMKGPLHKRREYVQPQWILDSLNSRLLLPVARYAAGATLPPHLSPFVDDTSQGYVPAYREELDTLRSAAQERRTEVAEMEGDESGEENEMKNQPKEEEDESEKAAQAFARDLERERAGMSFSKAMEEDEGNEDGEEEDAEDGEQSDDDVEDEGSDDEGNEVEGDVPVEKKQTEEQEHHELSKMMMSKKAKRLYGRMQHGLSKRREEAERLKLKRRKLEAQYGSTPDMASTRVKKQKKNVKKSEKHSGQAGQAESK